MLYFLNLRRDVSDPASYLIYCLLQGASNIGLHDHLLKFTLLSTDVSHRAAYLNKNTFHFEGETYFAMN